MAMRYSAFIFFGRASRQSRLAPAWRKAEPKPGYDVVIVGGGGHGLATAHYLAKTTASPMWRWSRRAISARAMSGATPPSSAPTICCPGNTAFYEQSLKLWEGLSQELNFNCMVSQRGSSTSATPTPSGTPMSAAATPCGFRRRCRVARGASRCANISLRRFRQCALSHSRRAVAAARRHHPPRRRGLGLRAERRSRGVDIIENCEVTGIRVERGACPASRPAAASSPHRKWGSPSPATARASPPWPACALPIESHVIQAFVSEGLKPLIDHVVTFGAGHFYVSQSDKGGLVFGGDLDGYNSYAQRGNLPVAEDVMEGALALFPNLARLRMLRNWGGIVDMTMDGSPIIDKTEIRGLYFNGGWNYGGFKATPASGEFRSAHRPRRAPRSDQGLPPRSLSGGCRHRREGHGRPTQSALS